MEGAGTRLLPFVEQSHVSRAIPAGKIYNQEINAQPDKMKMVFSDLRNPAIFYCAAVWRGRQKKTQTAESRTALAERMPKGALACPKTPSQMRGVGARDLCMPQQRQGKQTHAEHQETKTRKDMNATT